MDSSPSIKTAGIFYFSGTGGTEYAVTCLAGHLTSAGIACQTVRLEGILQGDQDCRPDTYDLVGFAYPIHAFNAPRIFFNFLKILPAGNGIKTFLLKVSADPFIRGGSTTPVRRPLQQKGYDVFYEGHALMPCNFLLKYDDRLSKQLCNAVKDKTRHMAADLVKGTPLLQKNTLWVRFISWAVYALESYGVHYMGKDLQADKKCTLCGLCVKQCPVRNITEQDGTVRFGDKCIFCMRCIYACPVDAISPQWGRFLKVKGGLNIQKIVRNTNLPGNYITDKTRGYFGRFRKYLLKEN